MKILLLIVLVALFGARFVQGQAAPLVSEAERRRKSVVAPIDIEAMLDAIAQVESGNDPKAIGRLGERSAYQIMERSWAQHSRVPFAQASMQPALARLVARQHLVWMAGVIERTQAEVAPQFLAAAWRYGPGQAWAHVRSDSTRRVLNLYFETVNRKRAAAEGAR